MGDVLDLVMSLRDFLANEEMPEGDEQIDRRFAVAKAPFSIENGQLTPSLKIRRHKIKETYGAELERLYEK